MATQILPLVTMLDGTPRFNIEANMSRVIQAMHDLTLVPEKYEPEQSDPAVARILEPLTRADLIQLRMLFAAFIDRAGMVLEGKPE